MLPKEQTGPQNGPRFAILFFSALCCLYGVNMSTPTNKPTEGLDLPTKLRRALVFAAIMGFIAGEVYEAVTTTSMKPSLLHIAKLTKFFCDGVVIIGASVTLMKNDLELSRMLRSNEIAPARFCSRALYAQLLLSLTSFAIDVNQAVNSVRSQEHIIMQIGNICGVFVWPIQYLTFCMYAQMEATVRWKLVCLSETMKSASTDYEVAIRVANSKIVVRNMIKDINDIFSHALIAIHVKVFFLCVYAFGLVILWKADTVNNHILDVAAFVSSLMQIAQIYVISVLGTNIIRRFQSMEAALFRPSMLDFGRLGVSHRDVLEVRSILEYREDYDSLRIVDDVANCKANMFTYIASMFTGTAIFLQFDYDVLSALERSKKFPSIWKE